MALETYQDPEGRRRIDRTGTHQDDNTTAEQKLAALMARFVTLEGKLEKALAEISTIKSTFICGPGHSGTIGNGQQFDPDAAGGAGGGGNGGGWRNMTDCDDVTMDVWVKNVVEPP